MGRAIANNVSSVFVNLKQVVSHRNLLPRLTFESASLVMRAIDPLRIAIEERFAFAHSLQRRVP
jgi:hypothetical protein